MKGRSAEDAPLRVARLRGDALEIFQAGLAAADAKAAVERALEQSSLVEARASGELLRLSVVAFGKAALTMMSGARRALAARGLVIDTAVAVVNRDNHHEMRDVEVFLGGHPTPDRGSVRAAMRVETLLSGLGQHDGLLVLVSGGGSSLLAAPVRGVDLESKVKLTRQLMQRGADIHQVNAVRKHLSRIKGGRLAALAAPARIEALIVSDVPGDDTSVVASGPTVPDATTFSDAYDVIRTFNLDRKLPGFVRDHLIQGSAGRKEESPKSGDSVFERVENRLVCTNEMSLSAMAERAHQLGYETALWSNAVVGSAHDVAASLAEQIGAAVGKSVTLAGGETTVEVTGVGRGGRCQEMALALCFAAEGRLGAPEAWAFLAAGTDGRDGRSDSAGALVDPWTLDRARRAGLDPAVELERNNSGEVVEATDDAIVTGPTGTNVADLMMLLVDDR